MLLFNSLAFLITALRALANAAMVATEKLDDIADNAKGKAANVLHAKLAKSESEAYAAIGKAQDHLTAAHERLAAAHDEYERLCDENTEHWNKHGTRLAAL